MWREPCELCGRRWGQLAHARGRVVGSDEGGLVEIGVLGRSRDHLDVHDIAEVVVVDRVHELAEHLEALALPGNERVGLRDAAQVDALVQVIHLHEVLAPALVDDLDEDVALHFARRLHPAREGGLPFVIEGERLGEDALCQLLGIRGRLEVLDGKTGRVVLGQLHDEALEVPVLGEAARAVVRHDMTDHLGEQVLGVLFQVLAVDDLQSTRIDNLALLVSHLVVLEQLLARLGVASLDCVLGPLDGLCDHARLDRYLVGQGTAHDPADGPGSEQPHELIFEREVEPAVARVALAARAAAELVVDPAALVALAAEDVQAAEPADLVGLRRALHLEPLQQRVVALAPFVGVDVKPKGPDLVAREALWVATEDDVDATTCHVGGDRDGPEAPRLGNDHGLLGVVLGVEHVVGDALFVQKQGELLGLGHRRRAHEHGLALLVALL